MSRWPVRTVAERFWSHVQRGPDCWEWTGGKTTGGYGLFSHGPSSRRAHRAAWIITHGPIPHGLDVCHHCDNPPCCNPDHLFLGTRQDNMTDAQLKGRVKPGPRMPGEVHPGAKLTWEAVAAIRASEGVSQYELARRYGVSRPLIGYVLRRTAWLDSDRPGHGEKA